MKEEFFSKFKDYNKELEKILEYKDFSKDTKNLLLSMFYKLEISYNDYSTVKRNVINKQEYLEIILNNIRNSNGIELIKTNDDEFYAFKDKMYEIDLKLKKIKVIPNELALLSAILELNDFQIRLGEKYNLLRNSMPYLLNTAYEMENIEVLRDFNAWSWNTLVKEIKDININLLYQNLRIALNCDIFSKIQNEYEYNDIIEVIRKNLLNFYNKNSVEEFLKVIFKISILKYINISENEKKRLLEEKEIIKQEMDLRENKKEYIEIETQKKKDLNKKLKDIDIILSDKELLMEEFERRNKQSSDYNKMFSISHLVERLNKEKNKILKKIEECNSNIEPQNFIENKHRLQKNYDLISKIENSDEKMIYEYIDELQNIFINKIFKLKIEKSIEKNELINCIYELRYYNFLPYTENKIINDVDEFRENIDEIEEILIEKLFEKKIINTISTNLENDVKILKNIFNLKIISIENIYIEVKKENDKYKILIYDEKETLEKEIEIDLSFNKKDKIKLNKKIKLFV